MVYPPGYFVVPPLVVFLALWFAEDPALTAKGLHRVLLAHLGAVVTHDALQPQHLDNLLLIDQHTTC